MNKQRYLCGLSLILVAFLFGGCSGDGNESGRDGSNGTIPAVEAIQAQRGSLPLTERLSGIVRAKNQVEIYPEISASVMEVYFNNGDTVKKGQALVKLRDRELNERLKQARAGYQIAVAQAKQAEAELEKIKSDLGRTKALADKGLASPTELENMQTRAVSAEADAELARARVDQAQAIADERAEALTQSVIKAPIDGSVGNRRAEVGMLVGPGTRLLTIGQLDSVEVEIILTDLMLSYIETGQRTEIISEHSPLKIASARLTRISPFLHPVTHSTSAEIDLANKDRDLKPGMFVTVDVFYGESEEATLIPLSALYEDPNSGANGVYVCRDSINRQPIEVIEDPGKIPLTDPLNFTFVPVDVIAKGRMSAGIRGIDEGSWVVTIGQDLISGSGGQARVRPVSWGWVEKLQQIQREDLLRDIMRRQQESGKDTVSIEPQRPSTM